MDSVTDVQPPAKTRTRKTPAKTAPSTTTAPAPDPGHDELTAAAAAVFAAADQAAADQAAAAPALPAPAAAVPDGPPVLNTDQHIQLLRELDADRISHLRGMSHLEAWDVRRWLIRIFGFTGWSDDVKDCALVTERIIPAPTADNPNGYRATVVYRITMRLTVKDRWGRELSHWEDVATGDAVNMPSIGDAHDFALKTAASQALKRCAANLGDQFGLSLYDNGRRTAVVVSTLADGAPLAVHDEPVTPTAENPANRPTDADRAALAAACYDTARMVAEDVEALRDLFREAAHHTAGTLLGVRLEATGMSLGKSLTDLAAGTPGRQTPPADERGDNERRQDHGDEPDAHDDHHGAGPDEPWHVPGNHASRPAPAGPPDDPGNCPVCGNPIDARTPASYVDGERVCQHCATADTYANPPGF